MSEENYRDKCDAFQIQSLFLGKRNPHIWSPPRAICGKLVELFGWLRHDDNDDDDGQGYAHAMSFFLSNERQQAGKQAERRPKSQPCPVGWLVPIVCIFCVFVSMVIELACSDLSEGRGAYILSHLERTCPRSSPRRFPSLVVSLLSNPMTRKP